MRLKQVADGMGIIADSPPVTNDPYADARAVVDTMVGFLRGATMVRWEW